MEKVKEVLHKVTPGHKDETTTHGTTHTGTGTSSTHTSGAPVTQPGAHTGPHSSGLANQADPRVDSDRDASRNLGATQTHGTGTTGLTGTHGTTGTTGTHTGTTGTHTGTTGTTGPHSSNLANKLDPRVDSDRDGSRNLGATQTHGTGTTGLTGSSGTHTGTTGTHTGTSGVPATQPGAHTGPHSSGLANQADPRVDSDRDASRNLGATQTHGTGHTGLTGSHGTHTGTTGTGLTGSHGTHAGTTGTGLTGSHGTHTGTTGTGLTGSHGTHTGTTSTSGVSATQPGAHTGPHSSGLANQADPRVDSDLDASRNLGATQTHGAHGTHAGTAGTHTGTTGTHTGTTGTTGSTTAGPHSSNILNKLDPRVDSDRDGSKTVGSSSSPDASKHTPSEFAKMTGGGPVESDHQRRHSLKPNDARESLKNI